MTAAVPGEVMDDVTGEPSRLPEVIGDFGPFDILSDWAHEYYVDNRVAEALNACAEAMLIVQAAGDRQTARYLRYIACLVHEMQGHWSRLRMSSQALLDDLEPEAGPFWRAKALGMHSQALIQQGRPVAALDELAEAYGLIMENSGTSHNRGSACQSVASPLRSALLFAPATELLRTAGQIHGPLSAVGVFAGVEEAEILGTWGLFLELLGRHRDADARFVECASVAIRAQTMALQLGLDSQVVSATAMLHFAYQRLRCEPVDERSLQAQARAGLGRESLLPRLALVSIRAREGDIEEAYTGTRQIRDDSLRVGEPVSAWVATAWLAELEVHLRGETEATRRWHEVALGTLERLWRDRQGRFEHLVARHRMTQLSRRMASEHTRLWEDALTSVGNRRLLDELLAVPGAASRPTAFIDIDHFKIVNDCHGHDVGDEVLRRLASVLRSICRVQDAVIRYGGDEFVVVLAEDGDVGVLAERIQAVVAAVAWDSLASGLAVTVTVGTAVAGPGALSRADASLLARRRARMEA